MKTLSLFLALGVLAGCAAKPIAPAYDMRFGNAVREARARMTLNPTPAPDTLAGVDGPAAREAQTRYHESFKAPPPVVNVINIGGAIGSGGSR
jgi:hypothetical protein